MDKVKIGLVGCGNICDIYFQNVKKFSNTEIIACCDIIEERMKKKAQEYEIPQYGSLEDILNNPDIEVVLNLTPPQSHAKITLAALEAGKHVYSEKPLSVDLEEGKKIIDLAQSKGLKVGCAPDTFLGGRLQMCRKIIDDGWLGEIIGGVAFMMCHGHEMWHPDPEFFYKRGAGPLFDMGPYYLTALIALLGPVKRIFGATRTSFAKRNITSQPKYGKKIEVEVPTHVSAILDFENGTVVSLITSFDVWDSHTPRIELYGSEGTLSINDADPLAGPNIFGGKIEFRNKKDADWNSFPNIIPRKEEATPWSSIPSLFGYNDNSRGIGLADMAAAIRNNREHRANGTLAYHVLEVMHGIYIASREKRAYELQSTCERPDPLPTNIPEFIFNT
ncbi:Gfo/Idh/MocA family protein [Atrimonas thermophila]|uniref:Gfo/Idh/MocA family protein n=1 Tax=Atrimonas thermophila TaxID=3064161 RepID=UPI00399D1EE0